MNAAILGLLAAGLCAMAATWLSAAALHAVPASSVLPWPAGAQVLPGLFLAAGAGAGLASWSVRVGSVPGGTLLVAARVLGAGALAVLATPALRELLDPAPGSALAARFAVLLPALLPHLLPAVALGAAIALIGRSPGARREAAALPVLLAVQGAGVALAARLTPPLLQREPGASLGAGVLVPSGRLDLPGAAALLMAVAGLLALLAHRAGVSGDARAARPASAGQAAPGPSLPSRALASAGGALVAAAGWLGLRALHLSAPGAWAAPDAWPARMLALTAGAGGLLAAAALAGALRRHLRPRFAGLAFAALAVLLVMDLAGVFAGARDTAMRQAPGAAGWLRRLGLPGLTLGCLVLGAGSLRLGSVLAGLAAGSAGVFLAWGAAQAEPGDRSAPASASGRVIEGLHGTVSLHAAAGLAPGLEIDGIAARADSEARVSAIRAGRISAALRPGAARVLLVGLGDGLAYEGLRPFAETVDAVEERAELLALARTTAWQSAPPRLHHAEPRAWLAAHPGAADLIVAGLAPPPLHAAERLLTVEAFRMLRTALAPGGVAVQWLDLSAMSWPAFAAAARAFLEAFPDARLLLASLRADRPLVALVGGLTDGVPDLEAVDVLLAGAPSPAGPAAAVDVLDLYVADAWTLHTRLPELPPSTLARPWASWLALAERSDMRQAAAINLRRLADLAAPLDTSSLAVRPPDDKQDRRLGAELRARSEALQGLLVARAASLELAASEGGELSDAERDALERELDQSLIVAWHAAPGHLVVRDALVSRGRALAGAGRWQAAATVLGTASLVLGDGPVQGLLSGVLLRLGDVEGALSAAEAAYALAPEDPTVLLNFAGALLQAGRDEEAAPVLEAARRAWAPQPLPAQQEAARALLAGEADGAAQADAVLARIPEREPWAKVLRRLRAARG